MRVVLALMMFSAALFFSSAAFASDAGPVTPVFCAKDSLEPGSGFYAGFIERFARFEYMGWLSLTPKFTLRFEGSRVPGAGPGLYLKTSGEALSARLSLSGEDKLSDVGTGGRSGSPVSLFASPAFREAFDHVRRVFGMPVIDNADSRLDTDYGMRFGLTWRFR